MSDSDERSWRSITEILSRPAAWSDPVAIHDSIAPALRALAFDKGELATHLRSIGTTQHLLSRSEANPSLTKLVLYADEDHDVELRVNIFASSAIQRPHTHRWPFVTLILLGAYQHTLYSAQRGDVQPLVTTLCSAGSSYALTPDAIHSTTPKMPDTVSLLCRGPAITNAWLRYEMPLGERVPQIDAREMTTGEQRALNDSDVSAHVDRLAVLGVI